MGSEPGMAWNWCKHLAKHVELFIITEGEFREKIERALSAMPQGVNMHFYYNPVSDKVRRMCWNQGDWRFYYYYARWQKKTLHMAREICSNIQIDAIHQLNMVGFRESGLLWQLAKETGIPFVWGPIGGIGSVPNTFLKNVGIKMRLFYNVKNLLNQLQLRYSPKVRAAMATAQVVITATSEADKAVREIYHRATFQLNETCCYPSPNVSSNKRADTFNLIWVGRFLYMKQLNLALDVMQRLRHHTDIRLHIVGEGFTEQKTEYYRNYARQIGVDHLCIWHGRLPISEVMTLMRQSDAFLFTSISETTSTVVLEAIGNQLPVICFNACGMADVVNEKIGIKIPVTNPTKAANDFAQAVEYLYTHRDVLQQMAENCKEAQGELSWETKAQLLVQQYRLLASQSSEQSPQCR